MSAAASDRRPRPLYTPGQRARRDSSVWTVVQAVLAPLQFLVFAVSLVLVLRYLATGDGYAAATVSILLKTALLYVIMVTGAIWEKAVFGQYLFAPAFFWEDVVSFVVVALHSIYLYGLLSEKLAPPQLMAITLAAYTTYFINATQFLLKLRRARLDTGASAQSPPGERQPA